MIPTLQLGQAGLAAAGAAVEPDPYFSLVTLLCPLEASAADLSTYGATPTVIGATFNDSVKLFGKATALMSGGIQFGDNAQYLLGAGAFCLDVHVYPTSLSTSPAMILSHATDAAYNFNSYAFEIYATTGGVTVGFGISGGSTTGLASGATNVPALNAWTHIRVRRMSSGSVAMFMNGVMVNSGVLSVPTAVKNPLRNPTPLLIGAPGVDMGGSRYGWPGRLANVRITVGEGRTSSNFSPPATPYATS